MTPILRAQLEDAGLLDIGDKVFAGQRLDAADGMRLFTTPQLGLVGALANVVRERLHGDVAWFNRNLHVNATNVCEASCIFCSFARLKTGDPDSWTMAIDEAAGKVAALEHALVTEVHVVNGLNPDLPYGYYLELIEALRQVRPGIHVKGFTAVEIHYYAEKYGMSYADVLQSMALAGLGSMPGGGAEIFHPRARVKLCHDKVDAEGWLEIHRTAHAMGMRTNCTMLFGSIETLDERVDHLIRLRELQDESLALPAEVTGPSGTPVAPGRFQTFIPLRFHNDNNRLAAIASPTGAESLRTLAVSRLMLDNIPHIKAYWPMLGEDVAQLGLHFGCSDIDGTVLEEHIYHMAGADTPQGLTRGKLVDMVRQAQRLPAERDTLYRTVRRDDAPTDDPAQNEVSARLGVVGYRNSLPLTRHLGANLTRRDGHPVDVARWLAEGEVDLALVPVAALLDGRAWNIVPELCVGCEGPVHSVLFVAETPPEQWTQVNLDGASRTSITLARLLLTEGPLKDRVSADLEIVDAAPGTGVEGARGTVASVVIGDVARDLPDRLSVRLDLGELWLEWTGLPFVFAVWAGGPGVPQAAVESVRAAGLQGVAELEDPAFLAQLNPEDRAYLTGSIRYALDDRATMGLRRFAALARSAGLVASEEVGLYPPPRHLPGSRAVDAPPAEDTVLQRLLDRLTAGEAPAWTDTALATLETATTHELMATARARKAQDDDPVPFELAWPLHTDPDDAELARAHRWMHALGVHDVHLGSGGWTGLSPARLSAIGAALGPGTRFLDLAQTHLQTASATDWRAAGVARLAIDPTDTSAAQGLAAAVEADLPVVVVSPVGDPAALPGLARLSTSSHMGLSVTVAARGDGDISPIACLRHLALGALILDGARVIAAPAQMGTVSAQLALHAGASDFGTVHGVAEPVVGRTTTWSPDAAEAERAIRAAGHRPARRSGDFAEYSAARTPALAPDRPTRRAPRL